MHTPPKLILTFDDLPLQEATRLLFEDSDFVRSEALLITDAGGGPQSLDSSWGQTVIASVQQRPSAAAGLDQSSSQVTRSPRSKYRNVPAFA